MSKKGWNRACWTTFGIFWLTEGMAHFHQGTISHQLGEWENDKNIPWFGRFQRHVAASIGPLVLWLHFMFFP